MAKPDSYTFNQKFNGQLYVFNNMHFKNDRWSERLGSDIDANALNKVFSEKFNFFTREPMEDLGSIEFLQKLEEICKADFKNIDCLTIAFLSHGNEGKLQMFDFGVGIDEIIDRLSQIDELKGKPKVLIFQACRGGRPGLVKNKRGDSSGDVPDAPVKETEQKENVEDGADILSSLPLEADFVLCNSTTKGFQAYRSPKTGSRYIQRFCEVLQNYAEDSSPEEVDLLHLLTKISADVATMYPSKKCRQMPSFTSTLTKLIFLPKQTAMTVPSSRE